ncbi:hypothetical protein [Psychroserpens ponticola]|uniref:Uncharacterized protein n=1 Tax=Psychroserpens ponticola TaxID=2932268 RepID=A0ABY7S1D7_9FLAO|nr:hypothetical protein [Psychroserpens ponticola]WCO03108.1 hypothetical protein MUN68_006345 [Psychroserpens ponticola]
MKILEFNVDYIPEFSVTLLFSIPYLIFILLISKTIGYYKHSRPFTKTVNNEINIQLLKIAKFDSKNYKSVKKELIVLLNNKNSMQKKEYLKKLIALRDKITI